MTKAFSNYFIVSMANVAIGNVSKNDMANENLILCSCVNILLQLNLSSILVRIIEDNMTYICV
jgi:hypothetical protein